MLTLTVKSVGIPAVVVGGIIFLIATVPDFLLLFVIGFYTTVAISLFVGTGAFIMYLFNKFMNPKTKE